jgi:CRP-like cAMP-binding protein
MNEKTLDHGSHLLRQGDITDEIFILWKGEVNVMVTDDNQQSHLFDRLNEGSCFCVYQAFKSDMPMLFDFKVTTTNAIIFTVKVDDLEALAKKDISLADEIKRTRIEIISG